jgi:hypothetical protein
MLNCNLIVVLVLVVCIVTIIVICIPNSNNLYFKQKEENKTNLLSKLVADSNVTISQKFSSFRAGSYFGQWIFDENGEQLLYAPNFGKSNFGELIIYPQTGLVRLWKYGPDGFDIILGKYDVTKETPPKQFIIDGISWDLFREW